MGQALLTWGVTQFFEISIELMRTGGPDLAYASLVLG